MLEKKKETTVEILKEAIEFLSWEYDTDSFEVKVPLPERIISGWPTIVEIENLDVDIKETKTRIKRIEADALSRGVPLPV